MDGNQAEGHLSFPFSKAMRSLSRSFAPVRTGAPPPASRTCLTLIVVQKGSGGTSVTTISCSFYRCALANTSDNKGNARYPTRQSASLSLQNGQAQLRRNFDHELPDLPFRCVLPVPTRYHPHFQQLGG